MTTEQHEKWRRVLTSYTVQHILAESGPNWGTLEWKRAAERIMDYLSEVSKRITQHWLKCYRSSYSVTIPFNLIDLPLEIILELPGQNLDNFVKTFKTPLKIKHFFLNSEHATKGVQSTNVCLLALETARGRCPFVQQTTNFCFLKTGFYFLP